MSIAEWLEYNNTKQAALTCTCAGIATRRHRLGDAQLSKTVEVGLSLYGSGISPAVFYRRGQADKRVISSCVDRQAFPFISRSAIFYSSYAGIMRSAFSPCIVCRMAPPLLHRMAPVWRHIT